MEYFLKASAITAIFYICYLLFLQRETFFESNRWFLLTGLFATIFMPLLIIPIYINHPNTTLELTTFTANINAATTTSTNYYSILLKIMYLSGVSFFIFKLALEFKSLSCLLRKNKRIKKNGFTFIETEEIISPFSFFHFIVYNPKQFSSIELEHIMHHEKVHAKQLHSIDTLLTQLATVVFWFNPFIWFYKKEVQQNLEFIADKNAQGISTDKKSYEYVLLKTSLSNQQLAFTNNFYTSLIKKRIVMLHKSKSNKVNALKYVLVLPILMFFIMSFNTTEIYINTNTSSLSQTIGNIETTVISKGFLEADLEKVTTEFESKDVALHFKNIKRNATSEIIAIKIEASSKNVKTNFSSNSSDAIKPIKISYNTENGSISISTLEDNEVFISEDGSTKIVKSGTGSNLIISSQDQQNTNANLEVIIEDENDKDTKVVVKRNATVIDLNSDASRKKEKVSFITKDKDGNVVHEEIIKGENSQTWVVEEGGANDISIFKTEMQDNKLSISTNEQSNSLIFIDGKESTFMEMNNLDANNIVNMHVLKGSKAIQKYGEKAKDGVILITTK